MGNEENIAVENIAENVETTTEQTQVEPVKTYSEDEVNEIVSKRLARNSAKIRKEYEKKYGELEAVLKAGTGKEDVSEMTDTFKQFYESKGIKMPTSPTYNEREIEVLAQAEANDIISAGFDEVVEETERLMSIGVENMSAREKMVFKALAEHRQSTERGIELAKIGVTEEIYDSKDFKDFAAKFGSHTPVTEIYEIYNKTQPRKEVRTPGSMKSGPTADNGVKDFYTRDEALKFTKKDFDNNPELFKAVERSMTKW